MNHRPYDPDRDAAELWECKAAFERELGGLGAGEKADTYDGKLTEDYRERYLAWVDRCVERDADCVTVAESSDEDGLAGYVFVLPEDLAMIWDAAVLNELYVRESARGTGLADDLLAAAYECARAQDLPVDRIALDVGTKNDRAASVYRREGFEPWGNLVARDLD
ncbi:MULTISPECIES: GNAT family N-acetyltransferase [Halococcus]|uniref:GCN5-related N-acetyltransferase n=1 Tax=Halococcus salifodinae DSM 8989 TaxID=1227456 RepID=M0N1M0_9EURY|nr:MULTISPECIES: GNAT family N-acetyltransferase [Halococcus]EMA50989.1 GCN5-related N-acetyltransferase [Halococcus salifodinae DSM 8989]